MPAPLPRGDPGARPLTLPPASKFVYETKFGLPVVRDRLTYNELLRDIRQGKVNSVHWFKDDLRGTAVVDGPCLVEYTDGRVKQANVPLEDVRIRYAMETHGVHSRGLPTMPPENKLVANTGFPLQAFVESSIKYLPITGFALIWAAVQFKDVLKGDAADRSQMRKRERQDATAAEQQRREDDKILSIQKMVANGVDDDGIKRELKRLKLDLDDEELEVMLEEARRAKARTERGTWSLKEVEDANVARRRAEIEGNGSGAGGAGGDAAGERMRVKGMMMRKARLRSVNRTKLKGKLKNVNDDEVYFDDVAGIDNAKRELAEIVDFFNFPERYAASGARSPQGCLLYGPPGTGKTLLARAVAGEANAAFLGVNASEFVEMFIGVGAARVRDLFQTARDNAPAVIFIDEIDAVGRMRGGSQGNDERDQTLNQMLSEMDGFDARSGVVVIAATNRRDVLDSALIRPGRFDRQVYVGPPSREGRVDVFKVHLRRFQWDPDSVALQELAFATDGYTGAMIANLCNLAALMANRASRDTITQADFETALLYEQQGMPAGRHAPDVTRRIAIFEGATALAASLSPSLEPVSHVFTQPTEKRRLGKTVLGVNEQRSMTALYTRRYLEEQLVTALAGRAAERLLLGDDEISSLNVPHINIARHVVHKLVMSAAMTENAAIGPRAVAQPHRGFESSTQVEQYVGPGTSIETMTSVDFEMERLLHEAEEKAYTLLQRNRACLDTIVERLCQEPFELSGPEVREIVQREANKSDLDGLAGSNRDFM